MKTKFFPILMVIVLALSAVLPLTGAQAAGRYPPGQKPDKVVFFVADGMRQDLLQGWYAEGKLPGWEYDLKFGAMAADNGLLTQAPPNTGAGWYSLATGAWSGVHGSTNNTFYKPDVNFNSGRVGAFDPNVLRAETLAQSAERAGKRVVQIEFAGGRNAVTNGPTVDYLNFLSGRGVATNYISPYDDAAFVAAFGLQFDHPAGFAGQPAFAAAAPAPASGWTGVPASYSPAMEMYMRVLDSGTNKYGQNAYIYDSSDDGVANYDRVLFSPTKDGANKVADLKKGEWGDVKVTVIGGTYDGKTAGFLIKVEELASDLSSVRLFHTSVTRANASWPGWPGEPGFTGSFEDYVAQKFPVMTAADYAVLEASIVSEETYVEQGLYWETGHFPLIQYILTKYQPDLALIGYPTTDEFQHQFLGLITPTLPNGDANPAYDDVLVDGSVDNRVAERTAFLVRAYKGAGDTLNLTRSLMSGKLTSFISSDHGFGAQFLAIDASQVLVDQGLLSKPQTSNCRTASGETIGAAKACWAGGTVQIYFKTAPTTTQINTLKAAFLGLTDPNDWDHDGLPEGWKVIDRVYTKAEARYIPNGPGSTADMAHPTRTGDLVVFSYPPYQFDAATPGTLYALSHFFGQHGYVPDVQLLGANTNMRATFIASGTGIQQYSVFTARTIDVAPTIAFLFGIPEPQQSQGRVLLEALQPVGFTPITVLSFTDFHGQLDPFSVTGAMDGQTVSFGGAAYLATLFDQEAALLPGPALLFSDGDSVGASPPNSALLNDMPTIAALNAWGTKATAFGNHEFDYGLTRLFNQQAVATFKYLAVNIIEKSTGKPPSWLKPSEIYMVNGIPVGVIGAALEITPELVNPVNVATLDFLPAVPAVQKESQRLRKQGVQVQILLVHEGSASGTNAVDGTPGTPWIGPLITLAQGLQNTTIDLVMGGHTHYVTNTMVGNMLVLENQNAGQNYSVVQMMVHGGDVVWAGGATRQSKILGVPQRSDVKTIVDDANTATAPLRNVVIGTQLADIKRDPTRLNESAMGNMTADAMRWYYNTVKPLAVDGAYTNSGGLRADINCAPPSGGEPVCSITWGEMFAVLPFGNSTVVEDLTGAQLATAYLNGFTPKCNPAISTGRFPQISGLQVQFHCNGLVPVLDGMWKAPNGPGGLKTPILPGDTVRIVTNDFMYLGGDGYTIFGQGTNVKFPGDLLLDTVIEYVETFSPVGPTVDGRIYYNTPAPP